VGNLVRRFIQEEVAMNGIVDERRIKRWLEFKVLGLHSFDSSIEDSSRNQGDNPHFSRNEIKLFAILICP